ncbi:hypothetical protein [Nocardia fusca]|uniref:Uncharacterized protein n=1 Tax=Nocardia fusca TaxID=941183 RepID=A0ABV3F8D4_9NOCA
MTAERYSDEWERQLAAAKAERDRLDVVEDVLRDMLDAAAESQWRKDFRDCRAEQAKLSQYRAARDSVWADRDAADDRANELEFGREFLERSRERRAAGAQARGIERSR